MLSVRKRWQWCGKRQCKSGGDWVVVVGRTFGREYNSGGTSIEAQRTIRRPSMSQDEIKKLPCFEYKMDQERENSSSGAAMAECAVCLESFMVGEKCRLLPKCKHSFHAECVDSWLLKTGACPICRTGVESPKITGHSSETEIELT
ncbi:hypothetical protein LguiA_009503 [Lonicera macranthoides]